MEVSVDTYIGGRKTENYRKVNQDGIEILISKALASHIENLELDCKKFLFIKRLRAMLEMRNGMIIAA